MARLADGARSELPVIYRALVGPVRAFCQRMLGDASASEDVAQQSLVRLFGQAPLFRRDGDVLTWAFQFAYWECRSELRRRGRRPTSTEVDLSDDGAVWDRIERIDALRTALAQLPEQEIAALATALDGKSLDASGRKRKQRALQRLRRWWREETDDE